MTGTTWSTASLLPQRQQPTNSTLVFGKREASRQEGAGWHLLSQAGAQGAQPPSSGAGTCLSLGILAVLLRLLLGLFRAPRPPVPPVTGALGREPDLPPGQSLISYFLVIVFWFIIIII